MKNTDIRLVALAFFLVAISLRFLPHWHNVTPMAALALFAGCHLSGRVGLILAFGAMAVSDLLGHWFDIPGMGLYDRTTMLTVYLSLGLTAGIGTWLKGRVGVPTVPAASLAATAVFFLATNFACWLDPIMGYAPTGAGLLDCYVQALPFARNTLLGDLFYTTLLFGIYHWLIAPRWAAKPAVQFQQI